MIRECAAVCCNEQPETLNTELVIKRLFVTDADLKIPHAALTG